jgi:FAR-17a/AIG1-like protein
MHQGTQPVVFVSNTCHILRVHVQTAKFWRSFTRFTDDFSCLAFTVSILITFQFWMLHLVTGGLVERSEDRPPWLGFSVHILNACLAVGDVLLSNPRTFSPRAIKMLYGYSISYACWIGLCRHALCKPLGCYVLLHLDFQSWWAH